MPPPSQAARRFWWWARNNPGEAKAERGIRPAVAKEFTNADPGGKLPERVREGQPVRNSGGGRRKPFGSFSP